MIKIPGTGGGFGANGSDGGGDGTFGVELIIVYVYNVFYETRNDERLSLLCCNLSSKERNFEKFVFWAKER